MNAFLPKLILRTLLAAALSAALLGIGISLTSQEVHLMPQDKSDIPWIGATQPPPSPTPGFLDPDKTHTTIVQEGETIQYEMFLSSKSEYPYASYDFNFTDVQYRQEVVDLAPLESFQFNVKCSPKNVLIFVLFTFDDKISVFSDYRTHRVNWHFFTCNGYWNQKELKLRDFETPDWWLQRVGLELADKEYDVQKAMGFAIVNSLQSPKDIPSQVNISGLAGIERKPIYLYLSISLVVIIWLGLTWWTFMRYAQQLVEQAKAKMKDDMPLTAYQKLSISPQVDKTKRSLLLYLAKEYADPELSLEATTERLGINRNKINSILKEELGLTFTAYVNKLRMSESARLLTEHPEESVSQIAYRVGFNNVSYFNKLFKQTYGCSPKHFKDNSTKPPP